MLQRIRKILVAVDGSEHSDKAIDLAVDMAKKWKAKIYLIHVVREEAIPEAYVEFARVEKVDVYGYYDRVCGEVIAAAEDRVRRAGIKNVESICAKGDPADEIIKTTERKKVDFIIMGSRGLGRFSKAAMGSVSSKVCNHAETTCITVK